MPGSRFTLEYFQSPDGDEPVRRWIFSGLDEHKRRAIVLALEHILRAQGIDVCQTEYGRHLLPLAPDSSPIVTALREYAF